MKGSLKNDKYKKARGGPSRLLDICCSACGAYVITYQKDGIGHLKRTYIDRIVGPSLFDELKSIRSAKTLPNLVCPQCSAVIGTPYVYVREARLAYLLNPAAFSKKIAK